MLLKIFIHSSISQMIFLKINFFGLQILRWVQRNESKLFGGRLETYVNPGGILTNKWNLLEIKTPYVTQLMCGMVVALQFSAF